MLKIEGFKFSNKGLNFIKKYQKDIDNLSSVHEILNFPFGQLDVPGDPETILGNHLGLIESQNIMAVLILRFGMGVLRYLITDFRKERKYEELYGVCGQVQAYDSVIGSYDKVFDEDISFIEGKVDLKKFNEQDLRDFLIRESIRHGENDLSYWHKKGMVSDFNQDILNQNLLLTYFLKEGVEIKFS